MRIDWNPHVLLPTAVGIEKEMNDVDPHELASHVQRVVQGQVNVPRQVQAGVFGEFHITDPQKKVWKAKPDTTADSELNTPRMTTFGELRQAQFVSASLSNLRLPPRHAYESPRTPMFDEGTGVHVHFDVSRLSPQQIATWIALMHRHQPFLYRAFHVNAVRRESYCAPLDSAIVGAIIAQPPRSLDALGRVFGETPADRNAFVNTQNLQIGGIKTVELRCMNATADESVELLGVAVGLRAYQIAEASVGPAPLEWQHSIDSPAQFAADFGLDDEHPLVVQLMSEAQRAPTIRERLIDDPSIFKDLPLQYRDDPELVRLAVSVDGMNLQYAGPTAQSNPDIVFRACVQDGDAFQFASPSLRADHGFVLKLMSYAPEALRHAALALRGDFEIVYRAVAEGSVSALEDAGPNILQDLGCMLTLARVYPDVVRYAQLESRDLAALEKQAMATWTRTQARLSAYRFTG